MVIFELAQGIFFVRNFFASSYSPHLLGMNVNIIIPGNQVDDVWNHLPLVLPILHRSTYDLFPTSIVSPHKSLQIVRYFLLVHRQWNPTRKFETFIRAVYYLLKSIARQTSLEIREFTLPGPGPCWQAQDRRGI